MIQIKDIISMIVQGPTPPGHEMVSAISYLSLIYLVPIIEAITVLVLFVCLIIKSKRRIQADLVICITFIQIMWVSGFTMLILRAGLNPSAPETVDIILSGFVNVFWHSTLFNMVWILIMCFVVGGAALAFDDIEKKLRELVRRLKT
jgi:hypothetical protein